MYAMIAAYKQRRELDSARVVQLGPVCDVMPEGLRRVAVPLPHFCQVIGPSLRPEDELAGGSRCNTNVLVS